MMMYGMMGGMWWGIAWMALWAFVGLTVLVLGALAIAWLVRNLTGHHSRDGDPAQRELRRRYAAGQISRDQYLEMSNDLGIR